MNNYQQLDSILAEHGLSLTRPRIVVFTALQQATEPLRAADIAKRCTTIHRASVYRTLDLFTSLHIITVTVRGWVPYLSLAEHLKPHHHHISCTHCGASRPIESTELETALRTAASAQGFTLQHHTLELSGLCAACRQATADATIGAPSFHLQPHADEPQSHCCQPPTQ